MRGTEKEYVSYNCDKSGVRHMNVAQNQRARVLQVGCLWFHLRYTPWCHFGPALLLFSFEPPPDPRPERKDREVDRLWDRAGRFLPGGPAHDAGAAVRAPRGHAQLHVPRGGGRQGQRPPQRFAPESIELIHALFVVAVVIYVPRFVFLSW